MWKSYPGITQAMRVWVNGPNQLDLRLQCLASTLIFRFGDFPLRLVERHQDVAGATLQDARRVSGILLQLQFEWWGERRCRVCVGEVW